MFPLKRGLGVVPSVPTFNGLAVPVVVKVMNLCLCEAFFCKDLSIKFDIGV